MENQKLSDKLIASVMKFTNTKGVIAIKDGMMYTVPLSLIGSIFLLLAQIPYQPFNDWVTSILGPQWTDPLFQVFNSSMAMMALVAVMTITYTYVKHQGHEPLAPAIYALVVFFTTIGHSATTANGEVVTNVLPGTFLGGQGMVTAIIIGLSVGAVYSWFIEKKITFKMPEGVPQGVANTFTSLIPGAVVITGGFVVYTVFKFALNTTFIEFIYKMLQTPLQGATDSIGGAFVLGAVGPFFWWFGIHGSNIVNGVMTGLLTSNGLANQAIINSGKELTLANGAHIVTQQFLDNFATVGGAGMTLGLLIMMIVTGRSKQTKALSELSLLPGVFNINEPILFGFPIVMNPLMFIPFILAQLSASLGTYMLIKIGFLHPFNAVIVPWSTPVGVSGFILQGWQGAVWQLGIVAISALVYVPFFKRQDNIYFEAEKELEKELEKAN